jgi:chromosomal replication initiator protein
MIERIITATADHFGSSAAAILSKDRHKSLIWARHIAMLLARRITKASYPELGRAFGNRDHATVMAGIRSIKRKSLSDPTLMRHIAAIELKLLHEPDMSAEQTIENLEMCA